MGGRPGEHGQRSQVDPVDAVQEQQLALQGSSDQRRRPPGCVSIGEGVPLLQKVPGCHVLDETTRRLDKPGKNI